MRIPCPYCGPRDSSEFSYLGDATVARPEPDANGVVNDDAMYDYVYLRANPAGPHRELWYHGSGCHGWLVVTRDTLTHEIQDARLVGGDITA
jgi:sarcosine oxidase subunit delta